MNILVAVDDEVAESLTYGDGCLSPKHFDLLILKRFLAAEKTIEILYNSGSLDN